MTGRIEVDVEVTDGGAYITVDEQRIDLTRSGDTEAVEHALVDIAAKALLGAVEIRKQHTLPCDGCDETGQRNGRECPRCDGTGRIKGAAT